MGRVGAGVTVRGYGGQENDVTALMAEMFCGPDGPTDALSHLKKKLMVLKTCDDACLEEDDLEDRNMILENKIISWNSASK